MFREPYFYLLLIVTEHNKNRSTTNTTSQGLITLFGTAFNPQTVQVWTLLAVNFYRLMNITIRRTGGRMLTNILIPVMQLIKNQSYLVEGRQKIP